MKGLYEKLHELGQPDAMGRTGCKMRVDAFDMMCLLCNDFFVTPVSGLGSVTWVVLNWKSVATVVSRTPGHIIRDDIAGKRYGIVLLSAMHVSIFVTASTNKSQT